MVMKETPVVVNFTLDFVEILLNSAKGEGCEIMLCDLVGLLDHLDNVLSSLEEKL